MRISFTKVQAGPTVRPWQRFLLLSRRNKAIAFIVVVGVLLVAGFLVWQLVRRPADDNRRTNKSNQTLSSEDVEKVISNAKTATSNSDSNDEEKINARLVAANLYAQISDYDAMLAELENIKQDYPKAIDVPYFAVSRYIAYTSLKQPDRADEAVNRVREQIIKASSDEQTKLRYRVFLARSYEYTLQYDKLLNELKDIEQHYPAADDPFYLAALFTAYWGLKREGEATATAKHIVHLEAKAGSLDNYIPEKLKKVISEYAQ